MNVTPHRARRAELAHRAGPGLALLIDGDSGQTTLLATPVCPSVWCTNTLARCGFKA